MIGRVLVVMNGSVWSVGWLAEWLQGAGVVMEVIRPYAGDPVPKRIAADGLIVLPGSVGVYQDEDGPWLDPLRPLLRRAVDERVPTLGICFGAQLLAAANGGEVAPVEPEFGLLPVE
jgi:GMP synthase (glutamine-hydrolysing)